MEILLKDIWESLWHASVPGLFRRGVEYVHGGARCTIHSEGILTQLGRLLMLYRGQGFRTLAPPPWPPPILPSRTSSARVATLLTLRSALACDNIRSASISLSHMSASCAAADHRPMARLSPLRRRGCREKTRLRCPELVDPARGPGRGIVDGGAAERKWRRW